MSKITIYNSEWITIEYHEDLGIIHHTVHKPVSGIHLREALNIATDFLEQHHVTKWLSDDRLNGPLPQEDVDWGFNIWNRRAIGAGWKYWALVVPEQIEAAGAMQPVIENLYNYGLRVMVFSKMDQAFEWLNRMQ